MSNAASATTEIVLVGCGGMGRRFLAGMRALRDATTRRNIHGCAFRLTHVIDTTPARACALASEAHTVLGDTPIPGTDVSAVLTDPGSQVVLITTSTTTHADIGRTVLDLGFSVCVEKPLTTTIADATALIQSAHRRTVTLAVAENIRREPAHRLAHEVIHRGIIGDIRYVTDETFTGSAQIQLTPWRHDARSGGLLLDVGVHNADVLEYLCGEITAVAGLVRLDETIRHRAERSGVASAGFYDVFAADIPPHCPADTPDVLSALLQFRNGASGHWTQHQAAHGNWQSGRTIRGSCGTIEFGGDRSGTPPRVHLDTGRILQGTELLELMPDWKLSPLEGAIWEDDQMTHSSQDFAITDRALIASEIGDFLCAVHSGIQPETDGQAGRRAIAVVNAVFASAQQRCWTDVAALETAPSLGDDPALCGNTREIHTLDAS